MLSRRWQAADAEGQRELPEDELMDWFVQLAEGMAHVHVRVLHHDLKPKTSLWAPMARPKLATLGLHASCRPREPKPRRHGV